MVHSIKLEAEVQPDGMLHLALPDALPGEHVKVTVEREDDIVIEEVDIRSVRVFGQFTGRGQILPGFYDLTVFPNSERDVTLVSGS